MLDFGALKDYTEKAVRAFVPPDDPNPSGTNMKIGYAGNDIPEEYLVKIIINRPAYMKKAATGVKSSSVVSKCFIEISSPIQEDIVTKFDAHWDKLSATTIVKNITNEGIQAFTSLFGDVRAPMTKWSTRSVWRSTTPIDFVLNMKFQAIYDAYKEVVQPCQELQRMILPYSPLQGEALSVAGLLSPPGPKFLNYNLISDEWKEGEIINIQIGKYLEIKKCVPVDIITKTPPRFMSGGKPVGASISVHFRTYEIVTKESLEDDVYSKNAGSGDVPVNDSGTVISEQ